MQTHIRTRVGQAGFTLFGALLAIGGMALFADDLRSQGQSYEDYKRLLDATPVLLDDGRAQTTKDIMERLLVAHNERDAEASVAELSEDYSWNKVSVEGAVKRASGLEITLAMTKDLYEGNFFDNYLGLDSVPIAVIGNLGIQYEVEEFLNEDGSKEVLRMLAIYETKNGKLWRLWAFPPFLGDEETQE